MSQKNLEILNLSDIHPGVSPGIASAYDEAVRVCLDRHHISSQGFAINSPTDECVVHVSWEKADEVTRKAWANNDDATEQAAYGVALAAIQVTRGLVAVRRAETRTGADYYLVPSASVDDFEATYRLEVSGTDKGDTYVIRTRVRQKIEQVKRGSNNLPAIVSVVGFSALKIISDDVD